MLRYTVVSSASRVGRRTESGLRRRLVSPTNLAASTEFVARCWKSSAVPEPSDWEEESRQIVHSHLREDDVPSETAGDNKDRATKEYISDFFKRRRAIPAGAHQKWNSNRQKQQQHHDSKPSWRDKIDRPRPPWRSPSDPPPSVPKKKDSSAAARETARRPERTSSRPSWRTPSRDDAFRPKQDSFFNRPSRAIRQDVGNTSKSPPPGRPLWRTSSSRDETNMRDNFLSGIRDAFPPKKRADSFFDPPSRDIIDPSVLRRPSSKKASVVGNQRSGPYRDMKDISALRAVFNRSLQKSPAAGNMPKKSQPSSWRPRNDRRESSPFPTGNRVELTDMQKQFMRRQARDRRFLEERNRPQLPSSWRVRAQENVHRRESENHQFNTRLPRVDRNRNTFFLTRKDFQNQQRVGANGAVELSERVIELPAHDMSVVDLSSLFRVKKRELMNTMKSLGLQPKDKHEMVDPDTMELLALELELEVVRSNRRRLHGEDNQLQRRVGEEDATYELFPPRPPVVCIMGHVDHGKTTLMDSLRARSQGSSAGKTKKKKGSSKKTSSGEQTTKVAGTEAGGITQVISAFQVALENQDSAVTFLDTPGHAAFRAMRESGSNAADVIVLVIAADDGVSPQTVEILNFYKSIVKESGGGISLVVAMTKIDKPGIDIEESRVRIENQLLEHGIMTETFGSEETEFGAPVQLIPVSGLTGEGVDDLVEGLVLQSEMMDLRADTEARAEGIVMDARMEKGIGVVADCVVRWGSLERGDIIVSGAHSGKIKTLKDVNSAVLKKGMPSQPVRIIGFKSLPKAGDPVICVASEEVAEKLVERRETAAADSLNEFRPENMEDAELHVSGNETKRDYMLQNLLNKYGMDDEEIVKSQHIRIPVIIKADADGTLAAVRESILGIGTESTLDIAVDPVSTGIGPISLNDVLVASESGATIFSFNVTQNDQAALALAETNGVAVRSHNVIYSLLDEAKEVFAEHLPPSRVEHVHGMAVVQAVFDINNKRDAERIAGLRVLHGSLFKSAAKNPNGKGDPLKCHYRVIRNGKQVSPEGETLKASSLRRVKEDVENVRRGDECGLGLEDFGDFQAGDTVECYSVELKRTFV